jgi:hypothetical protein
VEGPEHGVDPRKFPDEIGVIGRWLDAMVPVMKFRGDDQPTKWPEGEADVGVNEKRLQAEDDQHAPERCLGKAQDEQWEHHTELPEGLVDGMQPGRRQLVHLTDGVMHRVEAPQEGNLVACPGPKL